MAKAKKITKEEALKEAQFLKGWAKKKPIVHYGGEFWAAGKWMTKLSRDMVLALKEHGCADITGSPRPMYDTMALMYMDKKDPRRKLGDLPGGQIVLKI